jgi:anaerobic magnesium-protoporphyrin IX monomethyl ester cyclase
MPKTVLIALYDYHSLGIRGLHSWLKDKGHDVRSLYVFYSTYTDSPYTAADLKAVSSWLRRESPDYVGIGVRSPLFPLFRKLSGIIRRELPDCKIIVGGPHATGAPEACAPCADYVVVGEGEHALLDIVEGREAPGVIYGREVADLDSLPFPYYGPDAVYHGKDYQFTKISYNTSRGCFFQCSYCQECVRPVSRRRKSPARVAEELYRFKELYPKIQFVTFSDSVFMHDEDWIGRFKEEICPGDFLFWASGSAPFMSDSMLDLLRTTGFTELRVGVQSGSPYIRQEIFNRKDSLGKVMDTAWGIHRRGMAVHCDFITENPYDTPATLRETREYIRCLPPSALINKFELRYWPGTKLTARALRDGVIGPDDVSGGVVRLGQWSYVYRIMGGE